MNKKILIEVLYKLLEYIKKELGYKIISGLKKALKSFARTLWSELKDEIRKQLILGIEKAHEYCLSEDAKLKEEFILDFIMKHIELPVILKPFKGIVRNIIKGKLEKFVHAVLTRADKIKGD